MLPFIEEITAAVAQAAGLDAELINSLIETPSDPSMGDYALPCFQLSRQLRKDPKSIAADLESRVKAPDGVKSLKAIGPFLNFHLDRAALARVLIPRIRAQGDRFGSLGQGKGKTVVIDYSSPNIAKPFHVGHLRSTAIGNSLARIYRALDWDVKGINHLGDWGTQFGNLMTAYKRWGREEDFQSDPIRAAFTLYVRFHQEAENDPQLEAEGREWFRRLERGDREADALWRRFRDISLLEFNRIYELLDVSFESFAGEAFYNDKTDAVCQRLLDAGLASESQGALIVDLSAQGIDQPLLLRKNDGATLYATRDLAAAIYRKETYNFDLMLYVVGHPQELHFKQVFKTLELMGFDWVRNCHHVPFGHLSLTGGMLSTRKGVVVFLEDVIRRIIERVREIIEEKNPELERKDQVASDVGIGALLFNDLMNDPIKEAVFDWDRALDFDGDTGPYVMYAHARMCSILRKAGAGPEIGADPALLEADAEFELIKHLSRFPLTVQQAAEKFKPNFIARYLLDLGKTVTKFYNECPVIQAGEPLKSARLALVDATRQTLKNGLGMLGIKAPEQM